MPPKDSKKKGAKARGPKTADDGGAEARARVEEVEAAPAAAAAAVVAAGGGDIDADVEGPLAADDLVPVASYITNLHTVNEFSDSAVGQSRVHVRVHKRNGRSFITTIQGLAEDLDLKKILRACRKNFHCNGALVFDKEKNEWIVQLQGDQRQIVKEFMNDQEICREDEIVIHGH